jgi:hypothetical protein
LNLVWNLWMKQSRFELYSTSGYYELRFFKISPFAITLSAVRLYLITSGSVVIQNPKSKIRLGLFFRFNLVVDGVVGEEFLLEVFPTAIEIDRPQGVNLGETGV